MGAPTAFEMKKALKNSDFRKKVAAYIHSNIRAKLGVADLVDIPIEKAVSYSRPCDPRTKDYPKASEEKERIIAKAVQLHNCSINRCLVVKGGRLQCKRHAPFDLSSVDWISEEGKWGPKRSNPYLNSWNPAILQTTRSNNDIKLLTNGSETKDIAWYITNYATKKQQVSSNTSTLLAKRLAFHKVQERRDPDIQNRSRRLIQRCANSLSHLQEFSSPEIMSHLMGWGDRFISNHFAIIYLDSIVYALQRAFPKLCKAK